MSQEKIINAIEKLPVLPSTLTELKELYNNPNRDNRKVIEVLNKDPMIVTNLLKMTKSPIYGFRSEITDVTQVIVLFGSTSIINMVIYDMIKNSFVINLSPYNINIDEFQTASTLRNILVDKLLLDVDEKIKDKVKFASFIMDIGKIIFSNVLMNSSGYATFIKEKQNSIEEAEKTVFGMTSEEITSLILKKWNFDDFTINLIKNINTPEKSEDTEMKKYCNLLKSIKNLVKYKTPFEKESMEIFIQELIKNNNNINKTYIEKVLSKLEDKFLDL